MADNVTPRLKKALREAGCMFVRQGKGDHEIWSSPRNGKHFPVDSEIPSRHWANNVLTQAGLPKQFSFLPYPARERFATMAARSGQP
jgi:hypothetical protein